MRIVHMRRASAFCYGLCFALGAAAMGCVADSDLDAHEDSTSAAITFDANASYTLVGVQSNKCIGVVNSSTASLARFEIRTCSGIASQRFRPESMGSGFFRMRNELSGLCLDVSGASTADGAAVIQFACGTGTNQQWSFTDIATSVERVTARHSGKVVDVTGQAITDGTLIEQWTSNGGTNQQFRMTKALSAFGAPPRLDQ
jgi:polyhydroxybutyrate depolymerase